MAVSEQRLALFALLSEFEADARDMVETYISADHSIEQDLGSTAFSTLEARAAKSFTKAEINQRTLIAFLDIGDTIKILLSNRSLLPRQAAAAITKCAKQLEHFAAVRNRVMHHRPIEFDDLPLITDVLRALTRDAKADFKRSAKIVLDLASDSISREYAAAFSYDFEPTVLNNLPQADFEDTGFMGRRGELDDLRKAIYGPYPVVTVLGVGGAGKSALALNVAYDVLNNPTCPFDAIIWTSAKTSRLTGADVEDIVGAISSSIGIAEAALHELGEVPGDDPFAAIRELLSHFRILLFIDNLETILDERVRSFVRDIPTGSKIVFTSRIGLGAYDFVVPVKNLDNKEASAFLRRVAQVWKQNDLLSIGNEATNSYCVRLNNSPLGIKWFVQALAAGASAQRLLSNPKALLSFCLENIVDKLSTPARRVLNTLAITGREQSPASLHYISEIDIFDVEDALRELIASHLISVVVSKFGEEDLYKISPLAQTFISRLHTPSGAIQADVRYRQNQLNVLSERAEIELSRGYVYDPSHLYIRKDHSGTDSVAASYLRRALIAARKGAWENAFEEIEQAKQIASSYFEVMRIEGYIAALQGNTLLAQSAYEEAEALKPDYPPLDVLYAGFLMRSVSDMAGAEALLKKAVANDPKGITLRMELSRCYLYKHDYQAAWEGLCEVDRENLRNGREARIFFDLLVQTCLRNAEEYANDGHAAKFVESMKRLREACAGMPPHVIDNQIEKHLRFAVSLARRFVTKEAGSAGADDVNATIDVICGLIVVPTPQPNVSLASDGTRIGGRVVSLPLEKSFGFVEADDGQRHFFHRSNLITRSDFDRLALGDLLTFTIGQNAQGPCADDVSLVSA